MLPVGFRAEHLHYLAATGDQFGQALAVGVSKLARFRTNAFVEQCDDPSVERVGLGEPTTAELSGHACNLPRQC
jgi:hypothetical protein